MFYSPTTKGFYDPAIHGSRTISIPDPAWVRPVIDITLQPGESVVVDDKTITNNSEEPLTLANVPDMSVQHPTVEVQNKSCIIPSDAIEITAEYHAVLLEGQSNGQQIVPDENGFPVLVTPIVDVVAQRIAAIKSELSALDTKRIRPMAEGDTDYLATLNAQAVELREELKQLTQ